MAPKGVKARTAQALRRLGIEREVLESRSLLRRDDNWDGEGSPGYTEPTWDRAIEFLIRIASGLHDVRGLPIASVEVMSGSYGNIDIELRTSDRRLLFSIPAAPDSPARYYGHDESGQKSTKGTLDTDRPNTWLLQWFAE